MKEFTASFLGRDCPGVVAAITTLLSEAGCTIEAMSQTMLRGEFAAIFVVNTEADLSRGGLRDFLTAGLQKNGVDLSVLVRDTLGEPWGEDLVCAPFVVTVDGPDGVGLIAAMSRVFARHGVNIENLKAILDDTAPGMALFVFEVKIPESVNTGRLRRELQSEAQKLSLRVSMQHRDIFEAVNRVNTF